jgi:hypothetical protein
MLWRISSAACLCLRLDFRRTATLQPSSILFCPGSHMNAKANRSLLISACILIVFLFLGAALSPAPARADRPEPSAPPLAGPTLPTVGEAFLSAGYRHNCGLRPDGYLACWEANDLGQSAHQFGVFKQVSAGFYHNCGVREDGTLACWGSNGSGQASPPAGTYTQVSAGITHSCAIRSDGTLACWGYYYSDQDDIPAGTFTQVSAGLTHTCALRTNGTLACWGTNGDGEATPPAGTFTQIESGWGQTCALRTDGTLACWGRNEKGEATPPAGTFTQVSAGLEFSCALRLDGTPTCWGKNEEGQGTFPPGTYKQVSAGGFHTCAITPQNTLICVGENMFGQAPALGVVGLKGDLVVGRPFSERYDYASAYRWNATYTLIGGSLPPGLTLDEDGWVEGTPTTAGTYPITLRVSADHPFLPIVEDYSHILSVLPNTDTQVFLPILIR